MTLPGPLNLAPRLLLGPGPSDVHPRVLAAMSTPLLGHLDPQFLRIMDETQALLRMVYRTNNALTFPLAATGMAGMEACILNLIEPGDKMIVCVNGFFGTRMLDVADRAGAAVTPLAVPWGQVFDLERIREAVRTTRPKALGIVHAETSTGARQNLEGLGAICREFDVLLVVDAVTSLGCIPVNVDDWGIDAVYSCSQKGLGCPPGLSPASFSERAVTAIQARTTKVRSWYFDLTLLANYWGGDRMYHHTAPISMIYALHEGLRIVVEEGLDARFARHERNHLALKAGLTALNLRYIAVEGSRLPQLNAVFLPEGLDDVAGRKLLLNDHGIEVGGGLGEFKGKAWRIGIMGSNSTPENVVRVLTAIEAVLAKSGAIVTPQAGVAAAQAVYAASPQ